MTTPHTAPSDCEHDSASGVDLAPLNSPEKVWRCEVCGWLFHMVTDPETGFSTEVSA